MPSGEISGLAVGFAVAGGLLVYAGFKGQTPIAALKAVAGGTPSGVADTGAELTGAAVGQLAGGSGVAVGAAGAAAAAGGAVLAAAQKYIGDRYSQARRTQAGWSDCSSFADKVLRDVGIPPPVKWASTANYRISGEWKTIPLSSARAGDIAVNSHHMVVITGAGGSSAIGQQNPRVNVRTGTVNQLIDRYVVKRYVGTR